MAARNHLIIGCAICARLGEVARTGTLDPPGHLPRGRGGHSDDGERDTHAEDTTFCKHMLKYTSNALAGRPLSYDFAVSGRSSLRWYGQLTLL